MKEYINTLKIPTTVEGMGIELKKVCDDYKEGKDISTTDEIYEVVNYLRTLREDLFEAAVTERWVGKKRKKLIEAVFKGVE